MKPNTFTIDKVKQWQLKKCTCSILYKVINDNSNNIKNEDDY